MNQETLNNTDSGEQRKRKVPGTLTGDDDSIYHNQPQLLYATPITNVQQPPTASNFINGGGEPSVVRCPCVNCDCGWREAATMAPMKVTTEPDLDSLPIGYRFIPSDEELIRCYLEKKIKNEYIPKTKICETDIYEDHPKDLVAKYPQAIEDAWFFFTPRSRKYPNGYRPDRQAGPGYWKATGPDKIIKENDKKIGRRKSLVYHEGHAPYLIKTKWMMHEYVIEGYLRRNRLNSKDNKLDDYVLCKIYINVKKKDEVDTDQQPPVAFRSVRIKKNKKALVPDKPVSNNHDDNLPTNVWVKNKHALVPDQPAQHASVVSYQVKNNVVVQNYQNMRSPYDLMPFNYSRPQYSSLTSINHDQYSMQRSYGAPTPKEPPTPPPRHEPAPRGQVHAMMYQPGPSSNPPLPQVAPPFQEGGDCDSASLLRECIERTYALNGNNDLFGDYYQFEFDGNKHIDVDIGRSIYEEPKVEESGVNREWWS